LEIELPDGHVIVRGLVFNTFPVRTHVHFFGSTSFGLEVIRVDPFDCIGLYSANANIKINQKLRQFQAINQHGLGVDGACIFDGVSRKTTRCKKHALLRTFSVKGSDEFLNFGSPNRVVPTFGLQVDDVQAKCVLVYHPILVLVTVR